MKALINSAILISAKMRYCSIDHNCGEVYVITRNLDVLPLTTLTKETLSVATLPSATNLRVDSGKVGVH
jgi:hypothetical protein